MVATEFTASMDAIGCFEKRPALAVAVSGGADSMALLLLAHEWAQQRRGHVIALTVDHGLRKESAAEAKQVAAWCNMRGIEHHTLRWQTPKQKNIQEAARHARYELLAAWCRERHVLHLLTAHHAGDQAETLFFRLARGSNIDGLAGIPMVSSMRGIRLLRPLLPVAKTELVAFLRQRRQEWIDDPSNENAMFARVKIRQHLPHDLTPEAASVADRIATVRSALEQNASRQITQAFSLFPEGYGVIAARSFRSLAPEYALRGLSSLVQVMNGDGHPARTHKLERLHADLQNRKTRSFAGCIFQFDAAGERFIVHREPKHVAAETPLAPGETLLWDGRFELSHGHRKKLTVRAVGAGLRKRLPKGFEMPPLPAPVLASLPGFWDLEELLAVPHIGYVNASCPKAGYTARFKPAKPLAGTAFFSLNNLKDNARAKSAGKR